jgi:lipoprotein-releasing system permease protein
MVTGRRQFASFITRVSVAGLGLGVLVLTVVVSVMNGFDAELRLRILGTVPHLLVQGADEDAAAIDELRGVPTVQSVYPFFTGEGMVTAGGVVHPVSVYGVDEVAVGAMPSIEQSLSDRSMQRLMDDPRGLLMGAPLAAQLGLLPGDTLALVVSEPGPGGVTPRLLRYRLTDVFEVGAELDYLLVVVSMASLPEGELAAIGRVGLRVTIDDPLAAAGIAERIGSRHPQWQVTSWADSYGDLFQAVRLEKLMMFLILLMVVAVAAFNIISGQSMAVTDKRSDIAILRTMGALDGTISRIFLLQGFLISGVGIAVGLAVGVLTAHHVGAVVATAERWLGFRLLEGTYFVEVPSVVLPQDLVFIAVISLTLCLISAWIPARRAAALNPVDGLHG